METDYYYSRSHVPAFGSWDWNSDLPFTQCFESAREAGLLRYSYSQDRDVYVAGDLYENDMVTPAMIVVPARRRAKVRHPRAKEEKKQAVKDEVKEPASPPPMRRPTPKPVDEDLYKISPELLYGKPKKADFALIPLLQITNSKLFRYLILFVLIYLLYIYDLPRSQLTSPPIYYSSLIFCFVMEVKNDLFLCRREGWVSFQAACCRAVFCEECRTTHSTYIPRE